MALGDCGNCASNLGCRITAGLTAEEVASSFARMRFQIQSHVSKVLSAGTSASWTCKQNGKQYWRHVTDILKFVQDYELAITNNRTSVAGSSTAIFLGAQTNRGLENGCVVKRAFDERYAYLMERARGVELCCAHDLPCNQNLRSLLCHELMTVKITV